MGLGLEVMTFNLRHGWAEDGPHRWSLRQKVVGQVLRRHQAEVICFQEVNDFQLKFLIQSLPDHRALYDQQEHGPRWELRPIFVKSSWQVKDMETVSLSATPNRPSRFQGSKFIRQATRVLVQAGGRELTIYNTHLDFEESIQLRQASVIWQTVLNQDLLRPVILAGDFNSTPAGAAHRFLTGRLAFEGRQGDFTEVMDWPQAFTYHGFSGQPRIGYLDWILHRGPGLSVVRPAQVIYESHQGFYPSDHFPVKAGFELDH